MRQASPTTRSPLRPQQAIFLFKYVLLLHCECLVLLEENSVRASTEEQRGMLFLFSTHLCVEVAAFGFTNRRAVPLVDVLGLLAYFVIAR